MDKDDFWVNIVTMLCSLVIFAIPGGLCWFGNEKHIFWLSMVGMIIGAVLFVLMVVTFVFEERKWGFLLSCVEIVLLIVFLRKLIISSAYASNVVVLWLYGSGMDFYFAVRIMIVLCVNMAIWSCRDWVKEEILVDGKK